jgi:hypothetical protein
MAPPFPFDHGGRIPVLDDGAPIAETEADTMV